jgi:hypothetical protein
MNTAAAINLSITVFLWVVIITLLTHFLNRNNAITLKNRLLIIIASFSITCLLYYTLAHIFYQFYSNGFALLLFFSIPLFVTYALSAFLREKDV